MSTNTPMPDPPQPTDPSLPDEGTEQESGDQK